MDQIKEARVPCSSLLTYHRELLVTRLSSIQCILDNLFACGFFCQEDVEIVQQTATKADQVGKRRSVLKNLLIRLLTASPRR